MARKQDETIVDIPAAVNVESVLQREALSPRAALSIALGMKNAYRAFEKLEQVIRVVVEADQHLTELGQRTQIIEQRNAELETVYAAKNAELLRAHKECRQQADEELAGLQATIATRNREAEQLQDRVATLLRDCAAAHELVRQRQQTADDLRQTQVITERSIQEVREKEYQRAVQAQADSARTAQEAEAAHAEQLRQYAAQEAAAQLRLQTLQDEEQQLSVFIDTLRKTVEQFRPLASH